MPTIAVIDNGLCNLGSVTKAFEAVGATPKVVRAPAEVIAAGADGLVLPGVGALTDCVASLKSSGLAETVRAWIAADRPFLGVCLGMQALFDSSEEGNTAGLGIFPGKVVRFRLPAEFKVPHMGWNTVRFVQPGSPLQTGLRADDESFYFVHSFHCVPADPSLVLAECDYGRPFTAAIARGRCFATQFHPEKSQAKGLQIYRNFSAVAAGSTALV
ncbi:MAG: imidazole glycerol phosphate synthase [Rariglobus sp.]|jgi:glutamine amidotransferase|nr:imidazole glycerol phosphate synthase [Rariglobus sp.]